MVAPPPPPPLPPVYGFIDVQILTPGPVRLRRHTSDDDPCNAHLHESSLKRLQLTRHLCCLTQLDANLERCCADWHVMQCKLSPKGCCLDSDMRQLPVAQLVVGSGLTFTVVGDLCTVDNGRDCFFLSFLRVPASDPVARCQASLVTYSHVHIAPLFDSGLQHLPYCYTGVRGSTYCHSALLLQVCPAPDRRRKLLAPAGCAVPVNVSSTGLSLDTTLSPGLYSHTDGLEVLGLPTTPGK